MNKKISLYLSILYRESTKTKEKYAHLQHEVNMLRAKCEELEASKQAVLEEVSVISTN